MEHACRWRPWLLGCLLRWLTPYGFTCPEFWVSCCFWWMFFMVFPQTAESSPWSQGTAGCLCFSQFLLLSQNTSGWVSHKQKLITHSSGSWSLSEMRCQHDWLLGCGLPGSPILARHKEQVVLANYFPKDINHACENFVYMAQLPQSSASGLHDPTTSKPCLWILWSQGLQFQDTAVKDIHI